LDEVFKANSAILNTLLTLLNERAFDNGPAREAAPLLVCVAASNERPDSDELDALYDRFLFRREASPALPRPAPPVPPPPCSSTATRAARPTKVTLQSSSARPSRASPRSLLRRKAPRPPPPPPPRLPLSPRRRRRRGGGAGVARAR
jgi:hypothetical protein